MMRHVLSLALAMLCLLAGGGAARAADPNWEATVKAAMAEGEVNVHGGPGNMARYLDGLRKAGVPE